MGARDDLRAVRDRAGAARAAAGRPGPEPTPGEWARLVRLGSPSTGASNAPGTYYAAMPVTAGGTAAEGRAVVEGGTAAFAVTETLMAVFVPGPAVPPPGAVLLARRVPGHRWVAEYAGPGGPVAPPPACSLCVLVRCNGLPYAGVTVVLRDASGAEAGRCVTQGFYAAPGLPGVPGACCFPDATSGLYAYSASGGGLPNKSGTVDFDCRLRTQFTIDYTDDLYACVTAYGCFGEPAAGASVTIPGQGSALTGADGTACFKVGAPGAYVATVSKEGYASATTDDPPRTGPGANVSPVAAACSSGAGVVHLRPAAGYTCAEQCCGQPGGEPPWPVAGAGAWPARLSVTFQRWSGTIPLAGVGGGAPSYAGSLRGEFDEAGCRDFQGARRTVTLTVSVFCSGPAGGRQSWYAEVGACALLTRNPGGALASAVFCGDWCCGRMGGSEQVFADGPDDGVENLAGCPGVTLTFEMVGQGVDHAGDAAAGLMGGTLSASG